MKSIITVVAAVCTLVASLPGHAASKIHGLEYSEGPRCFNIQPHHHFDQTLRFRNQCSLDVTGLYCFVDTGNGHGTCENKGNYPLLRFGGEKAAWPEGTALEEFRNEFEKRGRRITVKGGKKKNLANLDFKVGLTGIIWSVCYVEDIDAGKCRIKPASLLWREKSALPKQDSTLKQETKPEPKPTAPKQAVEPEQPTAPKQSTESKPSAVPKQVAKPEQPTGSNPVTEPNPSAGVAQTAEPDCIPLFWGFNACEDISKRIVKWFKRTSGGLYAWYLAHKVWAGATLIWGVLMWIVTINRKKILGIITGKKSASN